MSPLPPIHRPFASPSESQHSEQTAVRTDGGEDDPADGRASNDEDGPPPDPSDTEGSALTEQLRAIAKTTPEAIVFLDADGELAYLNPAAERILGVDGTDTYPPVEELTLEAVDEHGDPLDEPERPHETVVRTRQPFHQTVRLTGDDIEPRWLSVHGAPLETEDGTVTRTVFALEDVTEERRRASDLEQVNAMLETVRDGVYALDDEGCFLAVNQAFADMVGFDRESLIGEPAALVTSDDAIAELEELQASLVDSNRDAISYEMTLETGYGTPLPVEARISLFPLGDERFGRAGVVRDISRRRSREEQLKQVNELSQALTAAETAETVCDIAVDAAHETLGLPVTAIERYDSDVGRLVSVSRSPETTALVGDDPLFSAAADVPWEVYTEQTSRVMTDVAAETGVPETATPLGCAIVLPIGGHGVFIAGSASSDAFGEEEETLAELFVGNVEAALERVDREAQLRARTDELEARTRTLERVNRINSVIRDITQVLTQATTRAEIEQTVCTQLATADPYRFAWVGDQHTVGGELRPRAAAGVEQGYLDAVTITADESSTGNGPAGRAMKTHQTQVQDNLYTDPPFEPWRAEALRRGYRASISIPFVYRETLYGTLNLYANRTGVFDDLEVTVLEELGRMIGYAINALERKKALVSASAVELTFRLADSSVAAIRFADSADARFEFESLVEEADGSLRAFFTIYGATLEQVERFAASSPETTDIGLVAERDDGYFYEATLSDESFLATLLEAGAHPTALTTTPEASELTVELPSSGDITAFLEMVLGRFEGAELTARRELDRPVHTEAEFRARYHDQLTDRQAEVVRTAYYAGFFNLPRDSSGSDVAEMLGVSQPTVNRHLRQAERKLFDLVFEADVRPRE